MKKILVLLGAMTLTLTLSMAEGKCQGGKCDDGKKMEKCDSGKSADKKEMKCDAGKAVKEMKCDAGKAAKQEAPAKGKCGQGKCGH